MAIFNPSQQGPGTPDLQLNDDPIPFKINSLDFDKTTTAEDGTWEDNARYVTTLEAPQRYEVVRQPVPGFKTITQATEPVALKALHCVVFTFTKDDRDYMEGLDNYRPTLIQCHIFSQSPILMYLESKTPSVYKTGMQKYALQWDLTFVECNDNNGFGGQLAPAP